MGRDETLTSLANEVRRLSGAEGKLGFTAMTNALKGVDLGANIAGADAGAGDVLSGKKFVGAAGVVETGSMTDNGSVSKTLDTSTTSYTIPAGKHSGSGKVQITTQEKSVTPSTSAQTVTPDSGKVLSKVNVGAVASATQATPSISVSSGGLITASATQGAGYVAAGTKSATKQLTTKGATTITPTGSEQTAVAAGTYCTGDILVAASTGKAVYSGTVTKTGSGYSLLVDTGVPISTNDTFLLIADRSNASYGAPTMANNLIDCVFKFPYKKSLFHSNDGVKGYDDVWLSGTALRIDLISNTDAENITYLWYLIKE